MLIHNITEPLFREYGKILEGLETEELLRVLETETPLPEAVEYVPEEHSLQTLPAASELSCRIYGGMPVQLGFCNGHNTKLNCLEYHRDSEVNLGTRDFILLLGKESQIGPDGMFDTADTVAFRVPAGTAVEVYATTLHYAPCSAKMGQGFKVLIVLPRGTNTEKPEFDPKTREDTLLTARNKWLLAHPDSDEAKSGAVVGLRGENIDIAQYL